MRGGGTEGTKEKKRNRKDRRTGEKDENTWDIL